MENDLSGLPIFLENSTDILGIHKGNNKTENYWIILAIVNKKAVPL